MKKIVLFFITVCMVFCLIGCGASDGLYFDRFNKIENETSLYYDQDTQVVYFIKTIADRTYMSPYYASNGFPYSYNVETGELEEINIIESMIKW